MSKNGMEYEDSKQLSKTKRNDYKVISEMSTAKILWFVTRKHKTALFAVWAISMTVNWAIPEWPSFIGAILF
jgi:ribonuclease HII